MCWLGWGWCGPPDLGVSSSLSAPLLVAEEEVSSEAEAKPTEPPSSWISWSRRSTWSLITWRSSETKVS